jgi:ubiquinone/menaquinone biosynthesis C-methylase UbiE
MASPDDNRLRRSAYKRVWTDLSQTEESAKAHVTGPVDEAEFARSGRSTADFLFQNVGIDPDAIVLEIGCGLGRVAPHLAPRCRRWIGCDVSPRMLDFARVRLAEFPNVELVETTGHDLRVFGDQSIDLVYCTVVFMHLESWDRYAYVEEAFRILRPGGKVYVDNANLCSDGGWAIFQSLRHLNPAERPAHITECSTPQELQTYLARAGFTDVTTREGDELVAVWGKKPSAGLPSA